MLLEVHTSKLFHCIAYFQDCNEEDCPVDCTISDWQDAPMTKGRVTPASESPESTGRSRGVWSQVSAAWFGSMAVGRGSE